MEPLKRGLSLFNFCYILYILLRVSHSCLNSRYFRNSHGDWNSTLYARVHCLKGLSFMTKIHSKICVELRCGRSEALDFRLRWSFWLHSYKKPPFWGLLRDVSWMDAMKFSKKTKIYPELHTICCRFCAAALSSEQKGLSQGLAICKVNSATYTVNFPQLYHSVMIRQAFILASQLYSTIAHLMLEALLIRLENRVLRVTAFIWAVLTGFTLVAELPSHWVASGVAFQFWKSCVWNGNYGRRKCIHLQRWRYGAQSTGDTRTYLRSKSWRHRHLDKEGRTSCPCMTGGKDDRVGDEADPRMFWIGFSETSITSSRTVEEWSQSHSSIGGVAGRPMGPSSSWEDLLGRCWKGAVQVSATQWREQRFVSGQSWCDVGWAFGEEHDAETDPSLVAWSRQSCHEDAGSWIFSGTYDGQTGNETKGLIHRFWWWRTMTVLNIPNQCLWPKRLFLTMITSTPWWLKETKTPV